MQVQAYPMDGTGIPTPILWFSVTVSMICHLFFFAVLIFLPTYQPRRSLSTPVIDVSIVSLPPKPEAPREPPQTAALKESKASNSVTKAATETPVKQKKKAPESISPSPKEFQPKASLKKKTFKSEKVVKQAISEIEKKVDQTRAQPVLTAIEELKRDVGNNQETDTDATGKIHLQGKKTLEAMDIYKAEIPYHIQKNWVYSEQLAGETTELVAWLVIEIMPDGHIRDIWFEKRSGNRYFDDQAFKAVKKSNPLPPLPKTYLRPFFNVGLRFTPSGLK